MHTILWQRIRTARRGPRLLLAALVCTVAGALAIAPAAFGSRSQTTIFDLGGPLLDSSQTRQDELLDEAEALGTDTLRLTILWRNFAPQPNSGQKPSFDATDPEQYAGANWPSLDRIVRGAGERGMNVLLTPTGPAPDWASASGSSGITDPNADQFQQFVAALGKRYSGSYTPPPPDPAAPPPPPLPRVGHWAIWNEPNLTLFLKPQFTGRKSVSGRIYRSLFLGAQRGLENTGHGNDEILIGETSPGPGRKGTDPIDFLRGVLCLNHKFKRKGGCEAIRASGWAQHPYDPFSPPFKRTPGLLTLASIGRLSKALRKAAGAGATTRKLPIYVTEYGVESVPDRKFGVSQLRQAEFIAISEYLMYRTRAIRSFAQYLLEDDKGSSQTNFQTGLRFAGGGPKISREAFPITLVAQRSSKRDRTVTIWGHVRPDSASVPVTVDFKPGPGKTVHTNGNGYFRFNTPFRSGRRYSAEAELPGGRKLEGPAQRVYVFK